jgi:hypothetical protein
MDWDIEYNTAKDPLLISEYGRIVQELLRRADEVEDDAERERYVKRVVKLMLQMQPQVKEQEDYLARLWKHAFRIGGELNVPVPEGIDIEPKDEEETSPKLPYPPVKMKWRHYGRNVQKLIAEAVQIEDEAKQDAATKIIAYYMKVAYTTWNRSGHVNEELIRQDLYEMSEGKLVLSPTIQLGKPRDNQPAQHSDHRKKSRRNRGNNNNNYKKSRNNRSRSRSRRR